MRNFPVIRRASAGAERPVVVLTAACLVAAVCISFANQRLPKGGGDAWDGAFERIPLPTVVATEIPSLAKPVAAPAKAVASSVKLTDVLAWLAYDLDAVRENGVVPHVIVAALPSDLPAMPDSDARKRMFIKMMLPLVLHVNEGIDRDRDRILALRDSFERTWTLSTADAQWLRDTGRRYGLGGKLDFAELLRRVDAIPPSLAVAQAAVESGWGTSRLAHEGRALFGQYTMYGEGPAQSEEAKNYRIKYFASLVDAVRSYATNLNTNPAYDRFRKLRANMRAAEFEPDGYDLADTLVSYSELGKVYIKSIRRIIDTNELSRFDDARLSARHAFRLPADDA